MKNIYLKLIAGLMCFKNVQPISHYSWAIFSASRMKALLVLKDLQPNRPDKATYLANHKKNWVVAVDPAVSLSTYSTLPMEVVP